MIIDPGRISILRCTDRHHGDQRKHPEQPADKFAVIPNGYDPTKVLPLPVKVRTGSQIKVVYIGTVYKRPVAIIQDLDAAIPLRSLPAMSGKQNHGPQVAPQIFARRMQNEIVDRHPQGP